MSDDLLDALRRRWRDEAMERGRHDVAIELDDTPVDREQALQQLRHERDDDQPEWRAA
jgi:hypothetical protein